MKQLNFIPGSMTPLWAKDLKFMQDGTIEAFQAVLKGLELGAENYLVCGCSITANYNTHKISMTSGWCFFQGELLPVKALPVTGFNGGSPRVKLTKVPANNPDGDRQITLAGQNGTAQIWQDCYLEPSVIVGENNNVTLALSEGAWTLAERISRMAMITDTGIVQVDEVNFNGSISYRKVCGTVQLFGSVMNDASGMSVSGQIAAGLPRPTASLRFPLSDGYMILGTDGKLTAYNTKLSKVYLDNIVYLTTPTFGGNDGHYSTVNQNSTGGGAVL